MHLAVPCPFTLLLLDYSPLERVASGNVAQLTAWLPLAREKIPLFVLTVISMIVTMNVQRGYGALKVTRVGSGAMAIKD